MRLETVELLTRDRDLLKRQVIFLSATRDRLKAKNSPDADEQLRFNGIETRLQDCIEYLAVLEHELQKAIPELEKNIGELENPAHKAFLFERYILLTPIKFIAEKLHVNLTAAYAMHTQARDAYNLLHEIPLYKDERGRKKGTPHFF